MTIESYTTVIDFWFTEIEQSSWFKKDDNFDQLLQQRFGAVHTRASCCELYHWRQNADGRLAEIIVLDQFSRNLYRGSANAFASDPLALALAQEAISLGLDKQLTDEKRTFLYMPFMHSESLAIHDIAMTLFKELGRESNYEYEKKHRAIIEKYGRYPHRNETLGRKSTPEEIEFLTQPGSSF
ncbi:hypothetical protein AB833_25445 [Chromatiales bacterium (ex Bugula neritina AB1)]|nr:hypothetical protein AB833_25445 [Chromatiales bacterium (ex Bugula neritina AB1)]